MERMSWGDAESAVTDSKLPIEGTESGESSDPSESVEPSESTESSESTKPTTHASTLSTVRL
ncbi:MAG TPA: hypothetical protein GX717_08675 [Clostridiaceae bacterium]|nr:hypothetical protein [Clostridiaceae bacterium]